VNHQKLVFVGFDRKDLKRNSLEIIADEHNSLVDTRVRRIPIAIDQLKAAMFNDVQPPLPRNPMLGR
jgi:hypothetical protein